MTYRVGKTIQSWKKWIRLARYTSPGWTSGTARMSHAESAKPSTRRVARHKFITFRRRHRNCMHVFLQGGGRVTNQTLSPAWMAFRHLQRITLLGHQHSHGSTEYQPLQAPSSTPRTALYFVHRRSLSRIPLSFLPHWSLGLHMILAA